MTAFIFYSIVLTFSSVFLLTVAHDEVTSVVHAVMDLLHR
jgi:hypothetical protein